MRLLTFARPMVALAATLAVLYASAQAPPLTEPQLKAAFVVNFARFVEWPVDAFASRDAPMFVCVSGRDRVEMALSEMELKPIQGHPVRLRRVTGVEDIAGCHVLYVGEGDSRRIPAFTRAIAGQPILFVSDSDGFAERGGAIGIFHEQVRLQFEVNLTAIQAARLRASSHLLRLARTVYGR